MTLITATTMGEASRSSLLRLLAWMSPSFPVGSFSYSHGLERAVEDGLVADFEALEDWLADLLSRGSAWNDAILCAETWRVASQGGDLIPVAEMAEALAGSAERHLETMSQGRAFRVAASAWGEQVPCPAECAYPVAVGAAAARDGVAMMDALAAFLQAFVSNQAQAAIRLSLIGQSQAASLLARSEHLVLETASRASRSGLDDLASCTIEAEIAAMRHETQYSRLFRS